MYDPIIGVFNLTEMLAKENIVLKLVSYKAFHFQSFKFESLKLLSLKLVHVGDE